MARAKLHHHQRSILRRKESLYIKCKTLAVQQQIPPKNSLLPASKREKKRDVISPFSTEPLSLCGLSGNFRIRVENNKFNFYPIRINKNKKYCLSDESRKLRGNMGISPSILSSASIQGALFPRALGGAFHDDGGDSRKCMHTYAKSE